MAHRLSADTRTRWRLGLLAGAAGISLVLAGCSSSSSSADTSPTSTASGGASGVPASIQQLVDTGYEGTFQAPPAEGPAAVTGKKVWVISCGQISESCSDLANGAMEAGKAIGWDMTLFDGKLQPATWPQGINQAVGAGADGIITVAADCSNSKAALQEAKSAGIVTVGLAAFDCDDPHIQTGDSVFTASPKYTGIDSYGQSYAEWTRLTTAWMIAKTDGAMKLIMSQSPGFTVSAWHLDGQKQALDECPGCTVETTVDITGADQASGQAQQKIQVALQKYPDANAFYGMVNGWFPAFVNSAFTSTSVSMPAVGGPGCGKANIAAIKAGGPQTGCVAKSEDWEAWAGVDEMNRQFATPGSEPVDQGLGFQIVDADHNLPSGDEYVPPFDFRAAYKSVWQAG